MSTTLTNTENSSALSLCIVGKSDKALYGLSGRERLRRQFGRAGITKLVDAKDIASATGKIIVARADAAIDQPLVAALVSTQGMILTTEATDGQKPLAAHLDASEAISFIDHLETGTRFNSQTTKPCAPSEANAHFWKALRKRETPYALLVDAGNVRSVEWRMFMGTYKGATDIVTKRLWPWPSFLATRILAPLGVTPNMVTSVAAVMTGLAFWLFLNGQFGWGLAAAWLMTFLDTVDGKLARTTLTSSKWGDVFDHGIDLVHPPFWYFAWAIGLSSWGIAWTGNMFWWVTGTILAGYVLQRLMEGVSIKWLGLEIHIWRKVDTFFREITARRNPNLILLTLSLLVNQPDWGLIAVAVWTASCLLLHGLQLIQAFMAKRATGPLQSWMTKPS